MLRIASDLEAGSAGNSHGGGGGGGGGTGFLTDNNTVLLVVGFVLGLVTVAIVAGFLQYYYCSRKANASRRSNAQSELAWGSGTGKSGSWSRFLEKCDIR